MALFAQATGTYTVRDIRIDARDGYPLAATLVAPERPSGRIVLINPAMAVPRAYYLKYAQYLAAQGFTVLAYDYRGVGGSRPVRLRGFQATLCDWGALDFAAVVDWASDYWLDLGLMVERRLLVVAHSIGGQLLGLADNGDRIDAVFGIACQSGYWGNWPSPGGRMLMYVLWHGFLTLPTRIVGYCPGSKLGLGFDVPAGVAQEWSAWGRQPRAVVDQHAETAHDHFERLRARMLLCSAEGDFYAPEPAVDALAAFYPKAQITRRHLTAGESGGRRIGHFGFFREACREPLWSMSAAWLSA